MLGGSVRSGCSPEGGGGEDGGTTPFGRGGGGAGVCGWRLKRVYNQLYSWRA